MGGPLDGVLVVDLTRVLAGPWCTQILGDLGADVIKVERPRTGDDTRDWGPPFLKGKNGETGDAAYFLGCNRNKRSLAIDITRPLGKRAARELAGRADIFVENFKVGSLGRYGLDYATLQSANPRLIYCSITGFGQTGPWSHRPGYDFMIQGLGGLMSVTGERDDLPGGGPQKVGVAIADLMSGMYAATGVLAALIDQRATGRGQQLDIALLDSQVAMLANLNMNYLVSGSEPGRMGNAHQNIVPYQTFATADGHIIVAAGNDQQFGNLCRLAGRSDLCEDERFARNSGRVTHRTDLVPILEAIFQENTSDWWLGRLEAAGVPCGAIASLSEVWQNPQVVHREMRIDLDHTLTGSVASVASPLRLSRTPVTYRSAPPLLGADTRAILSGILGWNAQEIDALEDETKPQQQPWSAA